VLAGRSALHNLGRADKMNKYGMATGNGPTSWPVCTT
jgi:hypothetical protein